MSLPVPAKKFGMFGLRAKLVRLTLAVLVPVVVFAAWMLQQNVGYARSQLLASNLAQAQVASASLDEYFANIQTLLEILARLTANQPSYSNLRALYVPALTARPSLAGIAALDVQGNLLAGLSWDSSQIRSDPFQLPRWPHQLGRPSVSDRLEWPATGEGVVGISVPIRDADGTLRGELQAWVPLKQLLLKLDHSEPANVVVVDSTGLVLAHPDWDYLDRPVRLTDIYPLQTAFSGGVGVEEFRSTDGVDWVAAYAPTANLHWLVLVMQPASQLHPPIDEAASHWAIFLGLAVLFAVGLGLFVGTGITRPLGNLNRTALLIAKGDLSKRTLVHSGDELEQLGQSFNIMAESLESTIQQLKEARREVERQARTLRRLLDRVIGAQEHERARIARDLHDEVNQLLVGALFQVQAAAQLVENSPRAAAAQIACAQEIMNRTLAEVKRVTLNLRPPRLEEGGLVPALRCLLDEFSATTGIESELRTDGDLPRLSVERETAVYRIVQESISNVRRHSRASRVVVQACCDDGALTIVTADDGKGFVPESVDGDDGHLGLTGMMERADGAGGVLDIQSSPGVGTTVSISVPIGRRRLRSAVEAVRNG